MNVIRSSFRFGSGLDAALNQLHLADCGVCNGCGKGIPFGAYTLKDTSKT